MAQLSKYNLPLIIRFFRKNGCNYDEDSIDNAVESRDIDVLKELIHNKKEKYYQYALRIIRGYGR